MAAKADTWMPFYVADYLRDTMHLTTELHGAYLLLLMAAWTRGGRLPTDDLQLSGIAKMAPSQWRKVKPVLLSFFTIDGADMFQKRAVHEAEKAQRLSDIRRETGSKGGRPPNPKPETKPESKDKPIGLATGNQSGSQTETPSPSPLPSEVMDANASLSPDSDAKPPARQSKKQDYPDLFEAAWSPYPHVKGRSSKPNALGYWRRLSPDVRGHLPKAVARYRREGREPNSECGAPAMERWLRDQKFLDWLEGDDPASALPATPEVAAQRIQHFRDTGEWRESWGPPPEVGADLIPFPSDRRVSG